MLKTLSLPFVRTRCQVLSRLGVYTGGCASISPLLQSPGCYHPGVNGEALCRAHVFKAFDFPLVSKPTFFPEAEEKARVKGRNAGVGEAAGRACGPGTWSARARSPWFSACGW